MPELAIRCRNNGPFLIERLARIVAAAGHLQQQRLRYRRQRTAAAVDQA